MSLLEMIKQICDAQDIPVMTGSYVPPQGDAAPNQYAVLTPMYDELTMYADDLPRYEIESVRLTLFTLGNFIAARKALRDAIIRAGITIPDMRFIEQEPDTGYYHYAIDTESIMKVEV